MLRFLLEIFITGPVAFLRWLKAPKEKSFVEFLREDESDSFKNFIFGIMLWVILYGIYYYIRFQKIPFVDQ